MASSTPTTDSGASPGLQRGAVSFGGVLFQSITFMAPAIATALSIPLGISFAGGAAPLAVILALVASLIAANSIGQLAKHLPSAGAFYTFVSHGIHPKVGFLVAWGFLLGVIVGGPFLALQMGFVVAGTLELRVGLVERHLVDLDHAGLPARLRPRLPRHHGVHHGRHAARRLRDRGLRRHLADPDRQGGERQHPAGVRHPLREQPRLQGVLRRDRGLGVHDPGLHRLRAGGADRRGGGGATPYGPAGDHRRAVWRSAGSTSSTPTRAPSRSGRPRWSAS